MIARWIDVKKRLPQSAERVLVALKQEKKTYTKIDTDRVVNGKWVRWNGRVTHWMPLPKLPKAQ